MRSMDNLPDNPWPHDMKIDVDECWPPLILLLFVRSAWKLDIGVVPPLESEPDPGRSRRPDVLDVDATRERWLTEWHRAWSHFDSLTRTIQVPDAVTQRLLDSLTDEELWKATSTWPSEFWESGIDRGALERWRATMAAPPNDLPENRVIPALVSAWQDGLTTVIQLPLAGHFVHRINQEHLVVSAVTRRDPDLYRQALTLPAPN